MPESALLAKSSCSTSEFFMYWTFAAPSLKAYGAPLRIEQDQSFGRDSFLLEIAGHHLRATSCQLRVGIDVALVGMLDRTLTYTRYSGFSLII